MIRPVYKQGKQGKIPFFFFFGLTQRVAKFLGIYHLCSGYKWLLYFRQQSLVDHCRPL